MEPRRTTPLIGALNFLSTLATENPYPDEQITNELHNETITVDTSLPKDTMLWETGIKRTLIEGKWVIVEQYPDREAAEIGHQKWVDLMTKSPDYPLKDIDLWGIDQARESLNEEERCQDQPNQ